MQALAGKDMGDALAQGAISIPFAVIHRPNAVAAHDGLENPAEFIGREEVRIADATGETDRVRMAGGFERFVPRRIFMKLTPGQHILLPERPGSRAAAIGWKRDCLGRQDIGAASNTGEHQAVRLQAGIRIFNRDAVNTQLPGKLTAGGQAGIGCQAA